MTARVLVLGASTPVAAAICARVREAGASVVQAACDEAEINQALGVLAPLTSLVIVSPEPRLTHRFLEVEDAELEDALDAFLALFAALQLTLPHLEANGHVLGVGSRGHLGGWGGAQDLAFAGALAGLFRALALELADRGVRANVIALDLPDARTPSEPGEAADLALYLMSPAAAAVNGELILANHGRSLKMREARDRRPSRASTEPVRATSLTAEHRP